MLVWIAHGRKVMWSVHWWWDHMIKSLMKMSCDLSIHGQVMWLVHIWIGHVTLVGPPTASRFDIEILWSSLNHFDIQHNWTWYHLFRSISIHPHAHIGQSQPSSLNTLMLSKTNIGSNTLVSSVSFRYNPICLEGIWLMFLRGVHFRSYINCTVFTSATQTDLYSRYRFSVPHCYVMAGIFTQCGLSWLLYDKTQVQGFWV